MTPFDPIRFKPQPGKPNGPIEVGPFLPGVAPRTAPRAATPGGPVQAAKKSVAPANKTPAKSPATAQKEKRTRQKGLPS